MGNWIQRPSNSLSLLSTPPNLPIGSIELFQIVTDSYLSLFLDIKFVCKLLCISKSIAKIICEKISLTPLGPILIFFDFQYQNLFQTNITLYYLNHWLEKYSLFQYPNCWIVFTKIDAKKITKQILIHEYKHLFHMIDPKLIQSDLFGESLDDIIQKDCSISLQFLIENNMLIENYEKLQWIICLSHFNERQKCVKLLDEKFPNSFYNRTFAEFFIH